MCLHFSLASAQLSASLALGPRANAEDIFPAVQLVWMLNRQMCTGYERLPPLLFLSWGKLEPMCHSGSRPVCVARLSALIPHQTLALLFSQAP